jgi:hypothetical protein
MAAGGLHEEGRAVSVHPVSCYTAAVKFWLTCLRKTDADALDDLRNSPDSVAAWNRDLDHTGRIYSPVAPDRDCRRANQNHSGTKASLIQRLDEAGPFQRTERRLPAGKHRYQPFITWIDRVPAPLSAEVYMLGLI